MKWYGRHRTHVERQPNRPFQHAIRSVRLRQPAQGITRELFAPLTDILSLIFRSVSLTPLFQRAADNHRIPSSPRISDISDLALCRQFCQFFVRYPYRLLVSKGFFLRGVRVAILYESHRASCTT